MGRQTECVPACIHWQQEDWVCILISGHVWPGLETKQYPLLDCTEIARGGNDGCCSSIPELSVPSQPLHMLKSHRRQLLCHDDFLKTS